VVTTVRDCGRVNRCRFIASQYHLCLQLRSPKIINSVLRSAIKETEEDEDFENRWSLIQHISQETAHKPSIAPISLFSSGFLNATIETLQDLVTTNCREDGLGHDSKIYMDWLADDAFGVIDARTAEDDTILFCVRETVDAIREAEVRLAWDKGLTLHSNYSGQRVPC
jgi:hypothetical protein